MPAPEIALPLFERLLARRAVPGMRRQRCGAWGVACEVPRV